MRATYLKNRALGVVATAAMLAFAAASAPTLAGLRYSQPGVVLWFDSAGGGRATGTLGGTRDSANSIERISCFVARSETVSATGTVTRSSSVTCAARDTSSRSVSCTSSAVAIANALNGVSNDSLLEFFFDATGKCTDINVYESASLERKS